MADVYVSPISPSLASLARGPKLRGKMKRNTLVTLACLALALTVMGTLTAYSVTLYRLFCEATGAQGTTQRVAGPSAHQVAPEITVSFDTNVAPGLAWQFRPMQRSVRLHLGQNALVFFEARNTSARAITGHAAFNVTPEKAGAYFKKIQCFCFTEETLDAGATAQMPVEFYVDPALARDPGTEDVHEITLSYTFFESRRPEAAPNLSRFAAALPNAEDGSKIFAQACSACHALHRTEVGPALAGVVGRTAGSLARYPYSAALKGAGFTWTETRLSEWLSGPQQMLPGTAMQMRLPEAQARQDVIAYLKAPSPLSN